MKDYIEKQFPYFYGLLVCYSVWVVVDTRNVFIDYFSSRTIDSAKLCIRDMKEILKLDTIPWEEIQDISNLLPSWNSNVGESDYRSWIEENIVELEKRVANMESIARPNLNSSFFDIERGEAYVKEALENSSEIIEPWLKCESKHPIEFTYTFDKPIGSGIDYGGVRHDILQKARIVLGKTEDSYKVLTAYPIIHDEIFIGRTISSI